MYNRYVPGHDGTYQKHAIAEPVRCKKEPEPVEIHEEKAEIAQQQRQPCRSPSGAFDLGDLLLLCVIILLLIDSEEEDSLPMVITAAAFLFLQ